MDEIMLHVLTLVLTLTFLFTTFLMHKTRKIIEKKATKNTASMFRVRDMVHGKTKRFKI